MADYRRKSRRCRPGRPGSGDQCQCPWAADQTAPGRGGSSEDDRHNYRDEHRKSDAQDEEGDGTELAAATVLILFLTLPATSLLR